MWNLAKSKSTKKWLLAWERFGLVVGGQCFAQRLSSFCGALQFSTRKCSARIWTPIPIRKSEALHSICEQAATITHWLWLWVWLLLQYRNEKFPFYLNCGEKQRCICPENCLRAQSTAPKATAEFSTGVSGARKMNVVPPTTRWRQ